MALKLFLSWWIRGIKRSSSANLPTNIYSSVLNNLHYTLTFTALWNACQPSCQTQALARIRREGRSSKEMKCRTPRHPFKLWRKTRSFHANLVTEMISPSTAPPSHRTPGRPLGNISLAQRDTGCPEARVSKGAKEWAPSQPGRTPNACKYGVCKHWLFQPLGHCMVCSPHPWRFVNGNACHC